jgi:hypothetical protein
LRSAAAGDEAAVRELFRAHAPKLQRVAARVLGADDPDVEDVVQRKKQPACMRFLFEQPHLRKLSGLSLGFVDTP